MPCLRRAWVIVLARADSCSLTAPSVQAFMRPGSSHGYFRETLDWKIEESHRNSSLLLPFDLDSQVNPVLSDDSPSSTPLRTLQPEPVRRFHNYLPGNLNISSQHRRPMRMMSYLRPSRGLKWRLLDLSSLASLGSSLTTILLPETSMSPVDDCAIVRVPHGGDVPRGEKDGHPSQDWGWYLHPVRCIQRQSPRSVCVCVCVCVHAPPPMVVRNTFW